MTWRRPDWVAPLTVTTGVSATLSLNLFAVPVLAPWIADDIRADATAVGYYTAIIFGVSVASSAAAGTFVLRWGAMRVSQVCLLFGALAAGLAAWGHVALMAAAAVALGVAFGPETPAATHLLARFTQPPRRPFVFSLKQTGIQIGALVAGFLAPPLARWLNWQTVLLLIAALSVALVAAVQPLRRTYDRDRDAAAPLELSSLKSGLNLVLGPGALRYLVPAAFAFSALQQCVNTFMVVYLVEIYDMTVQAAGVALSVAQISGIVGRILWGLIAERWIATRVLLGALGTSMTIAVIALGEVTPAWPTAALFTACAAFGISATGWNGIFVAEVTRLAPKLRNADAIGGMLAAAFAGVVVGPIAVGSAVAAGWSFRSCYLALGAGSLLGTLALFLPYLRAESRRDGAAQT
jgi:MFS family permease